MKNQSPEFLYHQHRDLLVELLQELADDPQLIDEDERIKGLIAKIRKAAKKQRRTGILERSRRADSQKLAKTQLFRQNDERSQNQEIPPLLESSEAEFLEHPQPCYICKNKYRELHPFYHMLCPDCARLNYAHRFDQCDLTGYTALVTGGRIKIGLEIVLKLLRYGANVIITTRFPDNAHAAYQQEADYEEWKDRLRIMGLDFRDLPALQAFVQQMLDSLDSLEILINNAAQTISRPEVFYAPLLAKERERFLIANEGDSHNLLGKTYFPEGKQDIYGQQLDLRPDNSWMQALDEVSLREMLEVQLVNVTAPFLLTSQLRPLMQASAFERKFVVHVSAMEGVFNRFYKSPWHPHTNMAKAALNMMTRTSAQEYAKEGIYMTSVDTGWITDENPAPKRERMRDQGFVPPLDCKDGAARVLAPIVSGINDPDTPQFGIFLKDYQPSPW